MVGWYSKCDLQVSVWRSRRSVPSITLPVAGVVSSQSGQNTGKTGAAGGGGGGGGDGEQSVSAEHREDR